MCKYSKYIIHKKNVNFIYIIIFRCILGLTHFNKYLFSKPTIDTHYKLKTEQQMAIVNKLINQTNTSV